MNDCCHTPEGSNRTGSPEPCVAVDEPPRRAAEAWHLCIHQIFEANAAAFPDAIALLLGDAQMNYGELNRRANRLAHRLIAAGVGPDIPVPVLAERSFQMIIALLAVLKAGGAFIPLNVNDPAERIAGMIEGVGLILAQPHLAEKLPSGKAVIMDLSDDFRGESEENPPNRTEPSHLAYVMFTSGSTGAPKGVEIPHRGVMRLVMEPDYVELSASETILQLAPISFDASTFEIWGALLNGGKLALMPPGQPSLDAIGETIRKHRVTTALFTTGPFNLMVDERIDDLRPLRQLLVGGEALSVRHVRRAMSELKQTRLINGYGPTESTTFACCYTVDPHDSLESSVPIGRPISCTTAHILDEKMQPVADGASGELFIGGDGLARGYWRRPEITAEKFVADPFSTDAGARLYKTGDLARQRPDGLIEFLGRLDHQVKIRGFRIEVGEVEAALASHPAIRAALVVPRNRGHLQELIAYFVPENGSAPSSADLRDFLLHKIPDYMVPAAMVAMSAFPLTAHGKIDRRALPEPPRERVEAFVAPSGELECSIAEIWRAVLGSDDVGATENFFEIGGDSMRLLEVHSKLMRALREPVSFNNLFKYPTISSLARFLRGKSEPRVAPGSFADRAQKQRAALARNLFQQAKE